MSKRIAKIDLNNVKKIEIYVSKCQKTLAQVKSTTGADYIINGGMWNPDGTPCLALKVNGKKLSTTNGFWGGIWGYAWNSGKDIRLSNDWDTPSNYISCTNMIKDGVKQSLSYGTSMGGKRGRTAIGLIGSTLVLYASQDGSSDAKTPENLQTEMFNMGCDSAVMLDGGGSSQCDFKGARIAGDGRKCHNYICVYLEDTNTGNTENEDPVESGDDVQEVWRITPSIGVNVRSGPGTDYAKTGAYAKGTLVTVTKKQNNWGKSSLGWFSLEYAELVDDGSSEVTGERVTDSGIVIKEDLVPAGRKNRPGNKTTKSGITVHETDNFAAGADAEAHAAYMSTNQEAVTRMVSWHYTVDDHSIIHHIPDDEESYHAGDGGKGPGNTSTIGIEICVNADGDYNKAKANAEALIRLLISENPNLKTIYQHYNWTGKDCPHRLRSISGGWDAFVGNCTSKDGTFDPADDWAQSSWEKGYKKGITDGTNPTNTTTRQEVMVYLDRLGLLD